MHAINLDNIHLLLYIMKIQNKVYEIALIVFHPLLDHLKNIFAFRANHKVHLVIKECLIV